MGSSLTVYVADVETVGKDAGPDRVVEVAVVPVLVPDVEVPGRAEVDRDGYYERLVRPAYPISFGAMGVHHITEEMVAGGPDLHEALLASPLGPLASAPVLCAHNAAFDAGFLADGLAHLSWWSAEKPGYWLDTWRATRHVLPDLEGYSNQSLRYELGLSHPDLPRGGAHRALGDALVTALLLARLLELRSLRELCALQGQPIFIKRFGFGKHRGESVEEVPDSYLRWLRDKSDQGPDEKFTARTELARRLELGASIQG